MEKPEQPPEGRLIADALKRSKLSIRKAAKLADISDGRWGQIVRGYQTMGGGVFAPVRGPAETLARMAHVVGVTTEQLQQAGRDDAAEELRQLLADEEEDALRQEASLDDPVKRAQVLMDEGLRLMEQARQILREQGTEATDRSREAG